MIINIINELILDGLFLPNGNLNPSYSKKFMNHITQEHKQWYDATIGSSFTEKIFCCNNNITTLPVCKHCGSKVDFISYKEGYRQFCSNKCKSLELKEKTELTNINKYGVRHPAQNKEILSKIQKTTKDRFGVDNIFKDKEYIKNSIYNKYKVTNSILIPGVTDKIKNTNLIRYGKEYSTQNSEIVLKRSQTNIKKYGNICSLHGTEIDKKVQKTKRDNYWNLLLNSKRLDTIIEPMFDITQYNGNLDSNNQVKYYKWKCKVCETVFEDYLANGKIPRCPKCYPSEIRGTMEKEVAEFIMSIFPNEQILFGNRQIIAPLELDIYIPSKNLAIEFDEIYWHCEITSKGKRDKGYHIKKTKDCNSKNINLIHIYDSEWFNKPEIVKSIICSKLGIYERKLNARECNVRVLTYKQCKDFLNINHIQGSASSSLHYGLFYDNELVSLLAIGKNRFKINTYEIVRFANKLNTSVRGGLSKLWKYIKFQLPEHFTLISYVDLRYFQGECNTQLGLKYMYSNKPSYYYTKNYKVLFNRMSFQKKYIKKNLNIYDENLTEWELMQLNGYDRIWDCGTAVYELKI
jgi:endogenous inhibitor of DNA gyrase (YacG/DUF329 family)